MWTDKRSLILSKCCTLMFMALLVVVVILAPRMVEYPTFVPSVAEGAGGKLFIATVYVGSVPAVALLVCLFVLQTRIGAGQVFVRSNIACLRYISWCCFTGAIISGASAFYYIPWAAVAVAAAFMGLIVRVLKNVMAKAVSLQDDAEFTV